MKTLILFVLYIVLAECRTNPIEVYEIRETNDRRPSLYVKNVNDLDDFQDDESPLTQLLKPYKKDKTNAVDKVTKNLLEKLKLLNKQRPRSERLGRDVYIIDASLLNQDQESSERDDEDDSSSDEARAEYPVLKELLTHLLPQKQSRPYRSPPSRSALRTYYEANYHGNTLIWGHGSAAAMSNAKQTLPYHPFLKPFKLSFKSLLRTLG